MDAADPGFCTNCGNKLTAGDRFCMSCGAAIEQAQVAQQPASQPRSPHPTGTAAHPAQPVAPMAPDAAREAAVEARDAANGEAFDPDMTVIRPRRQSADGVTSDEAAVGGVSAGHAASPNEPMSAQPGGIEPAGAEPVGDEPAAQVHRSPDAAVNEDDGDAEFIAYPGHGAATGAAPGYGAPGYVATGYSSTGYPAAAHPGASRRASAWNYLWLLLGIAGGVAGFIIIRERDPKRAKGVLNAGAVVSGVAILLSVIYYVLFLAFFAKGVSDLSTYSPTPYSTYYGSTPTPTPTGGKDVDSFTGVRSWTWGYTQTGGYSESVDFTVGDPIALSAAPYMTYSGGATMSAGDECTVDTARDAVVPFRMTQTNTTQGFEVTTGDAASASTSVEVYYNNSGATCKSSGGDFGGQSTSPVATNGGSSMRGFIILSDYYSPNFPSGDLSVLNAVKISVSSSTVDGSTWSLSGSGVSGPGSTNGGYGTVDAFYIGGTVPRSA